LRYDLQYGIIAAKQREKSASIVEICKDEGYAALACGIVDPSGIG
jgi:hypothetical protein